MLQFYINPVFIVDSSDVHKKHVYAKIRSSFGRTISVNTMNSMPFKTLLLTTASFPIYAFIVPQRPHAISTVSLDMASIGIFYGTSTGSTEDVADQIKEAFGDDAEGPFDVDALEGSVKENFEKFDAIVCGTPTW